MAEAYPATVKFDGNEQELTFEDGLVLSVQSGTFDQTFQCTIDKLDGETVGDKESMTSTYTFSNFVDPITGEPLVSAPVPTKKLLATVPKLVQQTVATALAMHTNPGEIPEHDDWTPDPDPGIEDIGGGKLRAHLKELKTFQVTK